ncbi:MAG: hypothetical protein K0R50_1731 [Eubacterium sp.]|nr:hypothetical protein [Eubacterium sp.]
MSITYSEIKNQYEALRKTFDHLINQKPRLLDFFKKNQPKSIVFIGSGSSYYISQSFEIITRVKMGIPSLSLAAGDLMINTEKYLPLIENGMIFAVSRSGSTSEIINAINNIKAIAEVPVISITCINNSPLERISDYTVQIPWAFDESVCQTRTVTNIYAAGVQVLSACCDAADIINDLDSVITSGDEYMEKYEESLKRIAELDWDNVMILADGELQGISMEAALAFKEISQLHSGYHHVLDSRHGPIVMVSEKTLVIACITEDDYKAQTALIKDMVKKGAKVIVYTDKKLEEIEGVLLHVSSGTSLDHVVRGVPFIYISQIVSYYKAIQRGTNPDKPDGLDAWIELK